MVISTPTELRRIQAQHVLYIQSEGNYSMLHITSGDSFLLTSQLGQIEQLISQQTADYEPTFVRVGKTLIINIRYVFYINAAQQKLQLLDATCYGTTSSQANRHCAT